MSVTNGWCKRCNIGYVAGVRVESARLFETLDPHGHEYMLSSLRCETCRDAAVNDGYCDHCRLGFEGQKLYFTRLTYGLARGTAIDPQKIACVECISHVAVPGWCDLCDRGMVGNVAFDDREMFESAAREFHVLLSAIDRVETCELCACMMVVHKTCPECGISYEYEAGAKNRAPAVDSAAGARLP